MNAYNARRAAALRASNDARYVESASGLMVPAGDVEVFLRPKGGERRLVEIAPNLMPAASRTYQIKAALAGFAQISTWYIAPFSNAVDPTSALTAANFHATLAEFTNYDEVTRIEWDQDAEASQSIANAATLATITCSAGGGTINGIAVLSVSTKSSGAGTLLSAIRFGTARPLEEGDELSFRYTATYNAA
jgi:hypothetical protein